MMKLTPDQLRILRETGWLREVAFKTSPDVTKLEIAALLESVYGMDVERVHTINYLGQKRMTTTKKGKPMWWRDDDWKKAYVVFRPTPLVVQKLEVLKAERAKAAGQGQEAAGQGRPQELSLLAQLRRAADRRRPLPSQRLRRVKGLKGLGPPPVAVSVSAAGEVSGRADSAVGGRGGGGDDAGRQ